MANREACELWIEQEIKEGLEKGETPYSIGKTLSAWVEKLFEAHIPPHTIEMRAHRTKSELLTNVSNDLTNENIKENQKNPGGRPQKYSAGKQQLYPNPTFENAIEIATFVISHLGRIMDADPKRIKALTMVYEYVKKELGGNK